MNAECQLCCLSDGNIKKKQQTDELYILTGS